VSDAVSPHPSPQHLAAFDAGTLATAARAKVEQHVAACPDCCRALDALPDDDFVTRVRSLARTGLLDNDAVLPDLPPELADHPRYHVHELLGAGGMGLVYRATHRLMQRTVALKVIHRRLSERPAFVEHFRREVQAVARLAHPNIVTAYDADQAGDVHFLVMEHVAGITLDRLVARDGPLRIETACDMVRQAALGLQHAHERGMVHRDVKPGNIIRSADGSVKVLDFGLAQLAAEEAPAEAPSGTAPLVGTPDYIAPEQARDPNGAGAASDTYGLGCTLYCLLTGQPPFPGGTVLQKLLAHQDRPPRPVTELRPDVPPALAALLDRMLAKNPARRPSAATVAAALAEFAAPRPRRDRPVLLLCALPLAVAAALAVLVYLALAGRGASSDTDDLRRSTSPELPESPPAPAETVLTAEQLAQQKTAARDRAADWLRANNHWGPDHEIVGSLTQRLDRDPDGLDGFQIGLGSGLVKSGRPTLLAGRAGDLYVFELTPAQARGPMLKPMASWVLNHSKSDEARRAIPRITLSNATLDGADALSAAQPWTGAVAYRIRERWAGSYGLRLTFYPDRHRYIKAIYHAHLPESAEGSFPFSFAPTEKARLIPAGPLVLFLEVVSNKDGQTIVESNPAAVVVRVIPLDPK
jgi:serine/threonine protein kinase